jgi:hypothetical protein
MIEIRKVEPERIPPPPASDHSGRVQIERRPHDQAEHEGGKQRRPKPEEELAAEEPAAPSIQTYDPDGHMEEHDLPGTQTHRIDFTA